MNGLIKFLNTKFAPAAAKVNKNTWINVLKGFSSSNIAIYLSKFFG